MQIKDNFWPSYADLMTSLFFVMLVLYILTFVKLKHDQQIYKVAAEKFQKIQEIERSINALNKEYFQFDPNNKRFRLNIDTKFESNSHDINNFSIATKIDIINAGRALYNLLDSLDSNKEFPVQYLIVIEGNTQRTQVNWVNDPDEGYKLSYRRALAIYNYWKKNNIDFDKLNDVEILLAGSGYFGKSRVNSTDLLEYDSELNRRFTIQITGKIGEFK